MKTGYKYFNKVNVVIVYLLLSGCGATATNTLSDGDFADSKAQATDKQSANTAASIETPLVSANDSLLAMLRYSRFINGLSKEQLAEEYKRINDAYFIRPNDRSGLKRAMLLMKSGTQFYDINQAKQLLTDIVNSNDNSVPAFKEYASFMLTIIDEQIKEYQRYNQLEEQMEIEIKERKKVEEKLEALKSIEESMIQRRSQ